MHTDSRVRRDVYKRQLPERQQQGLDAVLLLHVEEVIVGVERVEADGLIFRVGEIHTVRFNPFYTDDYIFDVEKKDSIKTLLLTLWKSEDDKVTKRCV